MANITKIKIPDLKKNLKEYDQKDLIKLVVELYKQNKDIQNYLSVKFLGDEVMHELFINAKNEINAEFFPDKGHGKLRLAKAKDVITSFKKLTNDHTKSVDLMLFYVEVGTKFTSTFGDIDERFYGSMYSMYAKVIDECENDEVLFQTFQDRLYDVVWNSDGIGWGYSDGIADLYYSLSYIEE
ncbi:DUF6155 family protein [Ornithinibacillus halophilus]|uniref:Uncharacterized protein n=1 Tax=Ornithinibacillus halophilus TaxID=930117 RepID=A0A1M5I6U3_9BACI|nr:DUF6155 family protein [Ornithinibacillus halophilus]SHG23493.1 hypothetical protein SAMN05216225_102164 [Ornithinibacillus halophilus]